MKYYPHHIGDFDRATRHLSRLERSIYRDLIELYYDTEKPLSLDTPTLCRRIIARSNEEATAVEQALNEFFIETPDGWFHSRCDTEIDKFLSSNTQKSQAGKASAAKRALKKQQALNARSTDVQQTCNGTPTILDPRTKTLEPRERDARAGKFKITMEWKPDQEILGMVCMRKGLGKDLITDELITDFVLYWSCDGAAFAEQVWVSKLCDQARRAQTRESTQPKPLVKPDPDKPSAFAISLVAEMEEERKHDEQQRRELHALYAKGGG